MNIQITTSRTGQTPLSLGRVNVFLGANGTGKSKLLAEIKDTIGAQLPDHQILNIEGGRALTMFDSLALDRNNFNNYTTYAKTYQNYQNKRSGTLQSRLFDGLKTLEQLGETAKMEHSDAVTDWLKSNPANAANAPRRPVAPMDRVFESFSDIFPAIALTYYPGERRLRCTKNGTRYGPTSLSEGEKQVFSILIDVVELGEHKSVMFVDEPELNLHPGLANRLWAAVESMLPEAVFFYATHSVSFAMRDSVEHLLVLSDSDDSIQQLSSLDDLPSEEKRDLLGNITSLISSKKTLIVEGDDESFDSIFYRWLVGDVEFSPTAVGGCEDVLAITERKGKWKHISPNVELVGVVDRDYKSDADVQSIVASGVLVLDFHEAESYLCYPDVLIAVASSLGSVAKIPSADTIVSDIVSFVSKSALKIVARRVAAQLNVRIGVSVPSKSIARVSTKDQLKRLFLADANQQKSEVSKRLTDKTVTDAIEAENKVVEEAIRLRDVQKLLLLAPGKELLAHLASLTGCSDANAVARAVRHHLDPNSFASLSDIRTALCSAFSSE